MVIPFVNVAGKITAALMNQLIRQVNATALAGIVPTSVIGTGTTLAPNGMVTFINSPSVALNGVFTGGFDNYRITWNSTNRSGSSSVQIRLRRAGADVTSNYDYVQGVDTGTVHNVTSSSAASSAPIERGIRAGQYSHGVIDLFGPALTQSTLGYICNVTLASSAVSTQTITFAQEDLTASDGFILFPFNSGETWSGIVRVYGYNTLS